MRAPTDTACMGGEREGEVAVAGINTPRVVTRGRGDPTMTAEGA